MRCVSWSGICDTQTALWQFDEGQRFPNGQPRSAGVPLRRSIAFKADGIRHCQAAHGGVKDFTVRDEALCHSADNGGKRAGLAGYTKARWIT